MVYVLAFFRLVEVRPSLVYPLIPSDSGCRKGGQEQDATSYVKSPGARPRPTGDQIGMLSWVFTPVSKDKVKTEDDAASYTTCPGAHRSMVGIEGGWWLNSFVGSVS